MGIDYSTKGSRIIKLDLSTESIQSEEIRLPTELISQNYKFDSIVQMGSLEILAVLSNEEQISFYRIKGEDMEKITIFQKEGNVNNYIHNVTVDAHGQIWVVLNSWAKHQGTYIGKYSPQLNTWTWLDTKMKPEVSDRFFIFESIAIDKLGRIWLSASQSNKGRHETHTIGVFEEDKNGYLVEIQHYTEDNSNLETSSLAEIVIDTNEKIWTWDEQLVWMDSRQKELPQPLPDWFVKVTEYPVRMSLTIINVVLLIVTLAILFYIYRKNNKYLYSK